jgi:hypothetical protein
LAEGNTNLEHGFGLFQTHICNSSYISVSRGKIFFVTASIESPSSTPEGKQEEYLLSLPS